MSEEVFTRCALRLIPFMLLLYITNYIDRVNVGFAALTMNRDLGFSPAVFGFGAGIFFVGYFVFQVPASIAVRRVGARFGMFLILAFWGALSAANALVRGPTSFYVLRFLLGIAEAGFFPSAIFYLTQWFPPAYRARFTAGFIVAQPLSFVIGGPLSIFILGMNNAYGLHGWQWLFLLEGLPAALFAFAVLAFLPNGPAEASWLSDSDKKVIAARFAAEDAPVQHKVQHNLWKALGDGRVLVLALILLGINTGAFGVELWLPQIAQGIGFSNLTIAIVVALPFLASIGVMILWGRSSDARNERAWHVVLPVLLAAAGFDVAGLTQNHVFGLLALSCVVIGILSVRGPFWCVPPSFLSGPAAAGGIAVINATGNLGGFVGPSFVGLLKSQTGGYASAMIALALVLLLSALAMLAVGRTMAEPTRKQAHV
jgi:ACS family tartrate transporter-like MFS transporter